MQALLFSLLLAGGDGSPAESPRTGAPSRLDPANVERCCEGGTPRPWALYNRGVVWAESLREARRRALAEGKLLLVFRLVGDLDRGGT